VVQYNAVTLCIQYLATRNCRLFYLCGLYFRAVLYTVVPQGIRSPTTGVRHTLAGGGVVGL
jgi:hypothetical protein